MQDFYIINSRSLFPWALVFCFESVFGHLVQELLLSFFRLGLWGCQLWLDV